MPWSSIYISAAAAKSLQSRVTVNITESSKEQALTEYLLNN